MESTRCKDSNLKVGKLLASEEGSIDYNACAFSTGESDGNGNLSLKQHPLTDVDLILCKVLTYLDKTNLKQATLVCKLWSSAARKLILKNMVLNFTEQVAADFLRTLDDNSAITIKNEISGSRISVRLSLGNFTTSTETKGLNEETALAVVEKLIEMSVKSIHLEMNFCVSQLLTAWRVITRLNELLQGLNINTDCACCSNTVNLQQNNQPIGDNDDRPDNFFNQSIITFPNMKIISGMFKEKLNSAFSGLWGLFQKLILSSPNLEGLHCQLFVRGKDVFNILAKNSTILQNLKSLSQVSLNQQELDILLSKKLKLCHLSMSLYSGFRYPALNPFLSSQGASLETLEIDFVSLPNIPEKFSCGTDLINLRHLTMKKFFGSIHFVSHLPNLESLTLEDTNLSVALHDEGAKYQYKSKLKSLKIFGGKGSTGRFLLPGVYNDIAKFFPEIRHLRMEYFTDSTLRIILKGLPYLEELDVPNGVYSDKIINDQVLQESSIRKVNYDDDYQEDQSAIVQTQDKALCLAHLKRLRKVVLQSPKITDLGICEGLLHCRELRSICIDSPQISDVGLKCLCKSQKIQHLEFINCYQLTSGGISEARQLWGKGRTLIIVNK